jgi:type II secretory pathway component PulF
MRTYSYTAIDSRGRRLSGEIEATDPDAVVAQLTAQGLRIETVQLTAARGQSSAAVRQPELSARLSAAETREVGGHISEIVSAGAPLEAGLSAIAQEFPWGRVSRALRGIVRDLEAGNDLESVLARRRAVGYLPALVRAGQRSGRTAEILENFITGSQIVYELRQILWTALAYPLILLCMLFPIMFVLLLRVVPQFGEIFAGFEVRLPFLTEVLLVTSEFLRSEGVWIVLVAVGAIAVLAVMFRLILGRVAQRRLMCRIPVIGPVLRWSAMARFAPLLSALIEARVPLDEALVLAGDAAGDAEIEDDCRVMAASLRAGNTLQEAADETGRFPGSFMRALTWERHQEGFPEVLRSMADMYAGRARAFVLLLAVLLPPLAVVFVAGTVGFVIVLLFMPLIELLNKLS